MEMKRNSFGIHLTGLLEKAVLCLIVSLLAAAFFPYCETVSAGSKAVSTVRVGYYENEVFQEGAAPDAVKTGYAYEYYSKMSEYTGWDYEYVYGGFSELYDMLLAGDIDLLAGLAWREDRAEIIGYPTAPMGNEIYTLVKHEDDPSVTVQASSLSGKRIGVLKSAIVEILEEYLRANSVDAETVTYDDYKSLFDAFDKKEIDILAAEGDGAYGREHSEVICTFGTSDYFLCVNIRRPDLLEELEKAQSMLAMEEPNYIGILRDRYYSSSVSSHTFSDAEREWLETNKSLRVGYLNNYLPYSSTESDGRVTGMVKEIIPRMIREMSLSDIEISYTGYDRYDDMIADIRDDRIDACFPVGGGLYYSEESGIYQSSPVTSSTTELVYRDEYDNVNDLRFAVNENNRMQEYYVRSNFPDAQIQYFPDIDSCLIAVLKGETQATTLNGLRADEILKNSRYKSLHSSHLTRPDDRCFGVKIGNEGLLKLLNRGIKVLGTDYFAEISNHYSDKLYTYTFADMVRDNLWLFLTLALFIALLAIFFIVRDLRRAKLADRMKTDFVSNMSHEIRTPITAIIGMNEMIQLESDDPKILQYSNNIEKAGESLLGIINDILDFSRIEAGRMELNELPYSLPELINDLQMMVMARAREKGLGFSMEIDEKLPVSPVGDMQKLRQVITNMLSNAVKYTKEGSVKMTVSLVSMEGESFVMDVSVEDTGIGIKKEEMDKLYSAFDRLDVERNRNIEGSGLGLAISQKLLAMMDSEIRVRSEYGKGSCFSFSVRQGISDRTPVGRSEDAFFTVDLKEMKRTASFTAPSSRILVVDDTPLNLQVICGLLKGNRINIDTAESGEQCLDLFGKNEYDLVFLDQRMPNMDGVETLAELKKLYPDAAGKTPVICLTANVLAEGKEMMLKAGFTDYLTKPVKLFEMEQMLLRYLPADKVRGIQDQDTPAEGEKPVIPEELKTIKEIDTEQGIGYCGDEEDFLDALRVFASSAKEKADKIESLFNAGDNENLSLLAHSVKSTSRAIGAGKLSELAALTESQAKDGDGESLKETVSEFTDAYRSLGEKLQAVLENPGEDPK